MYINNIFKTGLLTVALASSVSQVRAGYTAELQAVAALGNLTNAPAMYTTDTGSTLATVSAGQVKAVFIDGVNYKGNPTRFYAYIGIPAGASAANPVPGIVLIHGGGGTALPEYVNTWVGHGYAAIMIAVEGQTDADATPAQIAAGQYVGSYYKHNAAGPARSGIYGDSGVSPITDQWMYHACACTILANSLMRSLPAVDKNKVGQIGVSWGGIITATVVGIDNRFAFNIPVYGCGHLYDVDNNYGSALKNNELYKQVWDPMVRMNLATKPTMWYSWPTDIHFPMDAVAKTYRASPAIHMVSLKPGMGHGMGAGFNSTEPLYFSDSVLAGTPWCVQQSLTTNGNAVAVTLAVTKVLNTASLLSTPDTGFTGDRTWTETAITLVNNGNGTYTASGSLPVGTTAWFVNVKSSGVIATSDYQDIESSVGAGSVITWTAAKNITNTTDVSTNGTSVWAYNFGTNASAVINGVTFTGMSSPTGNASVMTTLTSTATVYGNSNGIFSTLPTAYQDILQSGANSGVANITLSGLTNGSVYEVQFWLNDSRKRADMDSLPRSATITDTTYVVDYNTAGKSTDNGLGQYIVGTFTAVGTTQPINLISAAPLLNAIQLRLISVHTNQAPTANAASYVVPWNQGTPILLTGTDPNGSNLTFSVVDSPMHGYLSGTAPALTYTPATGYMGSDSFTFNASDGLYTSDFATISIQVNSATTNQVPTAASASYFATLNQGTAILLTGTDPEGSNLTFSVVGLPLHGSLSGAAPVLTYTPTNGYTGVDSFTFTVSDGVYTSALATATIQVNAAGSIAWATPTKISNDNDVSTNGSLVWAYNFGTNSVTTVNGVTFTGVNASTTNGITTDMTAGAAFYYQNTVLAGGYSSLSTAYQKLVGPGQYKSGTVGGYYNLTGLTNGQEYEVQFWVNDSRTRTDFATKNRKATLDGTGSPGIVVDYNVSDTSGDVGQFIRGTFTADATGERLISFTSGAPQLNAIQLRLISVPSTGYAAWAASYGLIGNDALRTADGENGGIGDGYNNLAEFALGMNPTNSDARSRETVRNVAEGGTNWFEYVHYRRSDYLTQGLSYLLLDSTNLVNSTMHTNAQDQILVGPAVGGYEPVTNRYRINGTARFIQFKLRQD